MSCTPGSGWVKVLSEGMLAEDESRAGVDQTAPHGEDGTGWRNRLIILKRLSCFFFFSPEKKKWFEKSFLPAEFRGQRAWQATVHGVAKSWTQLSDLHLNSKESA